MKKICPINFLHVLETSVLTILMFGCITKKADYYMAADFEKVPKIDTHFHYDTENARYLQFADSLNFRIVSPNVDTEIPIDKQLEISASIKQQYPEKFTFLGTFSVDSFNHAGFAEKTIARIDECMKLGASGIKIWKNIGMVLKDSTGRFVMVDDPAFDPIFNYLEENQIPVLAHLGEPKDCWLPENEMTMDNNRRYYINHPQYHMFLHPESPSYEDQINARDNLLRKHPRLIFSGAHLGSMEWSVDEIAKRMDQFPNFNVDISARIGHLQYQALTDWEKVRNFMIKYQDRIMYGTDGAVHENNTDYIAVTNGLHDRWFEQWLFLATDSLMAVKNIGGKSVKSLQLPCEVIDKIYCKNAEVFFKIKNTK